ncbi:MAG: protein kinase domain-containing protein [Phycisphaerae bacterium]
MGITMDAFSAQPIPRRDQIEALARGELVGEAKAAAERLIRSNAEAREHFRKLTAHKFHEIPNYTIFEEVGKGGFGVVYKAMHHAKERFEALKVLFSKTPLLATYFSNEVHLIASLRHENIATLYEAQLSTPPLYYTMEFVEGERLSEYLKRGDVSLAERIRIIKVVAAALGYAHSQGVVHRDVKPQNILIDPKGQPRIVDFGIASRLRAAEVAEERSSHAPEGAVGTLGYVAPEQVSGARPDPRADVFSLGALLFHTLTGEPARLAAEPGFRNSLLASRRITRHEDLSAIVARCVEKDPERRYASTAALIDELDRFLDGRPILANPEHGVLPKAQRVAMLVLRRHPLPLGCGLVMIATLLLTMIFWEVGARTGTPRTGEGQTMIIGYTPETVEAIKSGRIGTGLPGLNADDRFSLRLLHGELMKKLADAKPSVVVWDYYFPDAKPAFDPHMIEGIRALREKDIPTVVGAAMFDMNGEPVMTQEIRREVHSHGALASVDTELLSDHYEVIHAVTRGYEHPIPGLALAAYAAASYPDTNAQLVVDDANLKLTVRYRKKIFDEGSLRWEPDTPEIPLYSVRTIDRRHSSALRYLNQKDTIATARVVADPAAKWLERTIPYHDVLLADQKQLQLWFDYRPVLVAQMLPGQDMHDRADGERIFGVQLHAQALDSLILGVHQFRMTRGWLALSAFIWCGSALVLIAVMRQRRFERMDRVMWGCGMTAAFAVVLAMFGGGNVRELWLLQLIIAISGLLLTGSLALLGRLIRERNLELSPPTEITAGDETAVLESTMLASRT